MAEEIGNRKSDMLADEISVPVIDLTDFPSERNKLTAAITALGCFRVVNHGIPAAMQAEMKAIFRSHFEIQAEVNLSNADIIPGSRSVSPSSKNSFYEALGLYNAALSSTVRAFCSNLHASPFQREIICSYASKLHALILDIASKVAESLGLVGYSFHDWPCYFKLNKYNFTNENVGSTSVKIHTDTGFLTVLQEDESVGGLEIMDSMGDFVAVNPVPGAFLVNLGFVAKAWSNGRLHNVKHRVQCKEAQPMISIALSMLAPNDDKVEPQKELIDAEHPRLYRTFTYQKLWLYSEAKAAEAEALSLLAADHSAAF